jgi:hypothetical protein
MYDVIAELLETLTNSETPERIYSFNEAIENMSDDARTIVSIIFESPVQFVKILNSKSPKAARSEILRILREEKGWGWPRCWKSFKEIQLALGGL